VDRRQRDPQTVDRESETRAPAEERPAAAMPWDVPSPAAAAVAPIVVCASLSVAGLGGL